MKKQIAEIITTLVGKSFISRGLGGITWKIVRENKDYYCCECDTKKYFGKVQISKKNFESRNVEKWI